MFNNKYYYNMKKIIFIRPPIADKYNAVSTQEEPIISSFIGFLENHLSQYNLFKYTVKDFVLNPNLEQKDYLVGEEYIYIVVSREKGAAPHYAVRLAENIKNNFPKSKVIIYGQIATAKKKLKEYINHDIKLIIHDEKQLAKVMGFNSVDKIQYDFAIDCSHIPYFENAIICKKNKNFLQQQ